MKISDIFKPEDKKAIKLKKRIDKILKLNKKIITQTILLSRRKVFLKGTSSEYQEGYADAWKQFEELLK